METTRNKERATSNTDLAKRAQRTAAEHCLLNYPTLYTAGLPHQGPVANIWMAPIVVVRPNGEVVGAVGELIIDVRVAKVVGGSPKEAVLAAGKKLARVKRNGAKAASGSTARKRG